MSKYGFVYIWRDRGKNRWYIGAHWGDVGDGYKCSSKWMSASFKKRPNDFKRRILKTNILSKEETYNEEYKWLQLIKKEELSIKYYNHKNTNDINFNPTGKSSWNKGLTMSPEAIEKNRQSHLNKKASEKTKQKISKAHKGRKITWADKISEAQKGNKGFWYGKEMPEETIKKMSEAKKGKAPNNKGKPWSAERREKFNKRFKREI